MLGLKTDQEVLGELVQVKVPGVWKTMTDQNVMWTLVVSRWFICLYIDILPVEVGCLHVLMLTERETGDNNVILNFIFSYVFLISQ